MAYLLDSNTLIQAKNEYYGFDLCPGFWTWLDQQNLLGRVHGIDRVLIELTNYKDELAEWASRRRGSFFLPLDPETNLAMVCVSAWVQGGNFRDDARRLFLSSADPFLVACALAHNHTVVTHEVPVAGERRRANIPTVCQALGVPWQRTFTMLRDGGAVFVLG